MPPHPRKEVVSTIAYAAFARLAGAAVTVEKGPKQAKTVEESKTGDGNRKETVVNEPAAGKVKRTMRKVTQETGGRTVEKRTIDGEGYRAIERTRQGLGDPVIEKEIRDSHGERLSKRVEEQGYGGQRGEGYKKG